MSDGSVDVLVIGGGITGLAVARAAAMRHPEARVVVLEKEPKLAAHASGRNSGVIHAGLYYQPGSLKANLCVRGARLLKEFCFQHGVPVRAHGKLVVATSQEEETKLSALARNATANGARVELVGEAEIRRIAPACTAATAALWSPDTATVDPKALLDAVARDAQARGVEIALGEELKAVDPARRIARTTKGTTSYGLLVNAAGSYADRIASLCSEQLPYCIAPFLGRYFQLGSAWSAKISVHLYPLPPDGLPFLGVHVTKSIGGPVYIGPTATPALGREHYGGLAGLAPLEALPAVCTIAGQLFRNVDGMSCSHVAGGATTLEVAVPQRGASARPRPGPLRPLSMLEGGNSSAARRHTRLPPGQRLRNPRRTSCRARPQRRLPRID